MNLKGLFRRDQFKAKYVAIEIGKSDWEQLAWPIENQNVGIW
jgi:hypothetical protein